MNACLRVCLLGPLLATAAVLAQDNPETAVKNWLNKRAQAVIDGLAISNNDAALTRQRETPSGEDRSTSLVDQSSASNFFSIAANLVPVGTFQSANGQGAAGSGSATVTLYSIAAALSRTSLTNAKFYKDNTWARNYSLTVGSVTSTADVDNTDKPGTLFGLKIGLINDRDIYAKRNKPFLDKVQDVLGKDTVVMSRLLVYVEDTLLVACGFDLQCNPEKVVEDAAEARAAAAKTITDAGTDGATKLRGFLDKLAAGIDHLDIPAALLASIDRRIPAYVEQRESLRNAITAAYDAIHKGRQLAIAGSAVTRPDNGNDDYRAELIFDWGFDPKLNWTINASGDYKNRKGALDSRGGRVATEFQARLGNPISPAFGKLPTTLSFAGEAKWLTLQKPTYTVQAKLIIPISGGLDLPITYRWANRRDPIPQSDNEIRFGFTMDLGRLAKSLASQTALLEGVK